jgi:hypothetical protein
MNDQVVAIIESFDHATALFAKTPVRTMHRLHPGMLPGCRINDLSRVVRGAIIDNDPFSRLQRL